MEEDVLNALQSRTAYLPGSFDRDGKIIFIVNVINDLQSWQRKCLELSAAYLRRSLSDVILQKGIAVIVDAQKTTARITRQHARYIYNLFEGLKVSLYLVKSEGFWEKHVETCTKGQGKGEPIVLSKARLTKFFDLSSLPEELGGTLQFNYDVWLQQRKSVEEFIKFYDDCLKSMENYHKLLQGNKSIRPTEADVELKKNAQQHATVQCNIETVIAMGNRILTRFNEIYAPTAPFPTTTTTSTMPSANATTTTSNKTKAKPTPTNTTTSTAAAATTTLDYEAATAVAASVVHTPATAASTTTSPMHKLPLPPDLNCERARIEMRLNEIEKRQTDVRTAWLELLQSVREAREVAHLEEGVAFVTNWILNTAEQKLNRQTSIGCDVKACEQLRAAHDKLELECRETYGFYAELLYKIDSYAGNKDTPGYRDLLPQKEFMQFVCRSFATRLERRRNILITSLRFYRLVSEYFERTTEVFESLVMGSGNKIEDLSAATSTLQKLKSSQQSLAAIERELIKDGEKLSDILSMPVKDALGRDLHIDYSDDIYNIREILDTTLARRKIFSDSVELQKLTLEQLTHIFTYEQDARMAIKWLDDLYNVMIKCHSHVGCNIHEIQVQKDELQTFQETGKSIFQYGCQLLEASQTLRTTCKLEISEALQMQQQLEKTWHSLQAISQEHMTRLRVSAVFHRSVEDYCQQLMDLRRTLRTMLQEQQLQLLQQQRSSSSGVSSESASPQPSSTTSTMTRNMTTSSPCMLLHSRQLSRKAMAAASRKTNERTATTTTLLKDCGAALAEKALNQQSELLRKYLVEREKLLVEVGRMVRLGRLLKTRLKEPFVLDAATGKSVVIEDLPSEITAPSPSMESSISGSSNNTNSTITTTTTGTMDSTTTRLATDPTKIVVQPVGSNGLACSAITGKLTDIAEVAESLDSVIRDIQENSQRAEVESNATSPRDKKLGTLRSTSSEDWHSRSTEDDSFVTASEGRTSSYMSCNKSSFDYSEGNDSTLAFDMPDVNSPFNMSFDESEQSFISAQQDTNKTPTKLSDSGDGPLDEEDLEDPSSLADIEDLHSESVTPTPAETEELYVDSIPIESETELEVSGIVDAPTMDVLTECAAPPLSVTPEVSSSSCSKQCQTHDDDADNDDASATTSSANNSQSSTNTLNTNSNATKPNAAWRRSKYYENITKQTIKGFL